MTETIIFHNLYGETLDKLGTYYCSKLSQRSPIYVYTMLLEFGSVSNWNALFAGYTMCYLLRVHGILFHSKFILLCMFEKKERKKEEGKKDT